MNWRSRIILDPAVLAGKPVVNGMRLAVDFILARGWSEAEVVRNYLTLTREDIRASIECSFDIM